MGNDTVANNNAIRRIRELLDEAERLANSAVLQADSEDYGLAILRARSASYAIAVAQDTAISYEIEMPKTEHIEFVKSGSEWRKDLLRKHKEKVRIESLEMWNRSHESAKRALERGDYERLRLIVRGTMQHSGECLGLDSERRAVIESFREAIELWDELPEFEKEIRARSAGNQVVM
jgi:hypothetical protein